MGEGACFGYSLQISNVLLFIVPDRFLSVWVVFRGCKHDLILRFLGNFDSSVNPKVLVPFSVIQGRLKFRRASFQKR